MVQSENYREIRDEALQINGTLEGFCPVQASGLVGFYPFYFHARWQEWTFSIAETQQMSAVDMQSFIDGEAYGFLQTGSVERNYDAGWMPLDEAERIIKSCCARYHELRSK